MYKSSIQSRGSTCNIYDFRSDTVTIPTDGMLQAMINAPVGDDLKGEDPTVNKLQEMVAKLANKESALYVCSGNMSNQLALRVHITNQSFSKEVVIQQVICDVRCHMYKYEMGGVSFLSQTQMKALHVPDESQFITAEMVEANLQLVNDLHQGVTSVICLENTINGRIMPLEDIKKIREIADKHSIIMHLDGARLWNASCETEIPISEYSKYFDSVSLCLSKGLGAPMGSVLLGTKQFILKAKQYRKLFGGGWRQAGYMASCGIYALENHWRQMKQVHADAKTLHRGLIKLGFEALEPQTNILFVNSKKLSLNWQPILSFIEKEQAEEKEEKVLLEGSGFILRLVLHHQTDIHAVHKLLILLEKAIIALKPKEGV